MSDPVVVAMGDEKLKDSHGDEENPELTQDEAKEASTAGLMNAGEDGAIQGEDGSPVPKRASQVVSSIP
jgi:hypothetical protein